MFITEREIAILRKSVSKRLFNKNEKRPYYLRNDYCESMNCYFYAIGLLNNIFLPDGNLAHPGFTINEGNEWSNGMVEKICIDLHNLGIKFRKMDLDETFKLKRGEALVKVYIKFEDKKDFHFIRFETESEIWFHKFGWNDEPEIIPELSSESRFGMNEPNLIIASQGEIYTPICYFLIK